MSRISENKMTTPFVQLDVTRYIKILGCRTPDLNIWGVRAPTVAVPILGVATETEDWYVQEMLARAAAMLHVGPATASVVAARWPRGIHSLWYADDDSRRARQCCCCRETAVRLMPDLVNAQQCTATGNTTIVAASAARKLSGPIHTAQAHTL